ncbi:hypothetical protein OJAV_G00108720 [Oryzias javanicus]|uniref:DNA-directed RNA polymerase I subunit RPA12 n=1 Tax=Oryzias javanicus TaxID=123683 RepID=A0A437CVN2_ORYJA|nr:hypothetical protein OJAV_G00108720 [Oryzias javanicus]
MWVNWKKTNLTWLSFTFLSTRGARGYLITKVDKREPRCCFPEQMSSSDRDPNFCLDCGSVLPLPGLSDTVRCPRCSLCTPVTEFLGREIQSTVIFNPAEQTSLALEGEETELKGPVIDRRCTRCNKEGMIYHTRQMRSADEGQTVFFTCIHCKFQEKEDS